MKKTIRLTPLLLAALLLAGCVAAPPDALMRQDSAASREKLISADAAQLPMRSGLYTLYFRYGDTPYLAQEERVLTIERNTPVELAVVRALLDGPAATASALTPLFPPGTEALAVSMQGGTLFVTFNEALLGKYADETGDLQSEYRQKEMVLRRRLCMDALTATLTEAGLCTSVQALVYREKVQDKSMRLSDGFYTLKDEGAPLDPLTRNESSLLTPPNAAQLLLGEWMSRDVPAFYGLVARLDAPDEAAALEALESAPVLTGFSLSAGNVSPDGQSVVLTADLSLRDGDTDLTATGYPLRMIREDGIWKITYAQAIALMNQE